MKNIWNPRRWRLWLTLGFSLLLLGLQPLSAFADVEFQTWSRDSQKNLIWTQPAYYPVAIIGAGLKAPDDKDPNKLVSSPMQNPQDLFVDSHDNVYVADTNNNRVVEFDPDGNLVRFITVPESKLNKPQGVFVTKDDTIYIADTGNKRVIKLSQDGKLLQEFKKPNSKFIPDTYKFDPTRLVVDKRGFLYIATLGGYQGLLQLAPDGTFQSFYGANTTELSALDKLKKALYTKEMYANEISKLPGAISSVAVDKDGFIYTTTNGPITTYQVKKLNIRGENLLMYDTDHTKPNGDKTKRTFGEVPNFEQKFVSGSGYLTPQLIDLTVDINGNITVIDSAYKILSQYDSNGNLLFFWGGLSSDTTTQFGLLKNPIAIDSNSKGDLLVLDNQEGTIQKFRFSEFGKLVNQANSLTTQGRYQESEKPWEEVLRYNAYFTPALIGLGKAAYQRGDYELAKQYFYEGGSHKGYSDAFWQIRLVWFQARFPYIASTVIILGILYAVTGRLTRKTKWRQRWRNRKRSDFPVLSQIRHALSLINHPIDGFTALRYEGKGNYWSAFVLLALGFAALAIKQLYTGFTFNYIDPNTLNLVATLVEFVVVWLGWVVCNYLVSAIFRGEGRFRDVFIASSYALMPLILVGIPLTIISNGMTLSELSIYNILYKCMEAWIFLMFFWKIQSLQNYSVGETALNIVFSAFAFLMLGVIVMTVFGLTSDMLAFINEVYQEVRLR